MKDLKIYFTSDLHGYVYPTDYVNTTEKNIGILNIINSFEKDDNTLIIDGGDTIQGSPFTNYLSNTDFDVHPIATIFNEGQYDFVTLGNHDFNYGKKYLKKYLDNLNAKCVCANVIDNTGELPIQPYQIKTMANGLEVGILGITTDFINRWERPENIENINITRLLTGHQHIPISNKTIFGTHIVQTPHNGSKFVKLNLTIDDNGSINIISSLEEIKLNPNKEMFNKFLPLENKVQEWLDTPVGFLSTELQPGDRLEMALNGSHLANFINQIQLETSDADISCTAFANVIHGFNKNISVRNILSTYPYPNTLVVLEVNREILKLALERSASYFNNDNGNISISQSFLKPKLEHYNYDYFANIEYTFDLNKEVGNRVVSIKYKGEELNYTKKLTLVMNNYRASGAGGYECYDKCKVVKEIVLEMPEIIINYFKNNPNVTVDLKIQ